MKTAIVDTGGGLRGVYTAGVLDYCLDQGVSFDLAIGVSAGGANLAAFVAGQRGRNYRFYTEYAFRKEYMGLRNLFSRRCYLNLEYIYATLSNSDGEDPLDYAAFCRNPTQMLAVATDALTGEPVYFSKADVSQDDYRVFMASAAVPLACPPCEVGGRLYYDGGLGDPVPIEKAFELGCDRVVLLLTKPKDVPRRGGSDRRAAAVIRRKYPASAARLLEQADAINGKVELALRYEREGRLLIVAPDDIMGLETLTRDRRALRRLYDKGYADAAAIPGFLSRE
ncbi:MAG: patatin family protein [Firmicutes bacterium]|nr:patatin family protein [Bacillota bacterium]